MSITGSSHDRSSLSRSFSCTHSKEICQNLHRSSICLLGFSMAVISALHQIFGIFRRIMQLERNSLSQLVIGTSQLKMNMGAMRSGSLAFIYFNFPMAANISKSVKAAVSGWSVWLCHLSVAISALTSLLICLFLLR